MKRNNLFTCGLLLISLGHEARAGVPMCEPASISKLFNSQQTSDVNLKCSLTFGERFVLDKRLVLEGEEVSGLILDCQGGTIVAPESEPYSLLVRSRKNSDGSWSVPRQILIKNCTIIGGTRVLGMGINGQAEELRASSASPDHTDHAQAAAPSEVTFEQVTFEGRGTIPLYIAPGVTHTVVRDSTITGYSHSTAIYLDAESAYTELQNSTIDTQTDREFLAIDGSAHNVIEQNHFVAPVNGGIYVYRNCGEGGTVRHQMPQWNVIRQNTFDYSQDKSWKPAIWLGSREGWLGWRTYCNADAGYPWGSSQSNDDFADYNQITDNLWRNRSVWWSTVDWGDRNVWLNNRQADSAKIQ